MENSNPLGIEKISKLIFKYSIPAIVGMMVNALYNIVDRIYIGNSVDLSINGIAAITVSFPIMIISLALGILFGVGGATLFSIKLGDKKPQDAESALGNSFVLLSVSSLLFMIIGYIFLTPILNMFGASEASLPYAVEYMRVILFGSVFQIVSIGLNNFMRADGSPKLAMLTMLLGAGINILLDPLFIFVFKMGMTGAALATVIAQFVSFVWVILYFIGKKSNIKLKVINLKLKLDTVLKITYLGLPGFLLQIANSLLNSILNKSLYVYGGDIAVSSMGIINSLQTLMFMPIIGLRQGIQPIISFNYGAKNYDRVKKVTIRSIQIATIISVIGFAVIRLFPIELISLFNQEPELLEFGSFALVTWMLLLPLIGFQIIASNFFSAIGKPNTAIFLTLTRQAIFLIPALLVFSDIWGIKGLLYAAPFADLISTLLTGLWFYFGYKELDFD